MSKGNFSKIKFLYRAVKYRYKDDAPELGYILKNINSGDSVLDIGTHKGGYLHWLRKAVGDSGSVIAFEPQPSLYKYVSEAINAYGYKNITLHHAGVSSRESTLELFIPKAEGLTSPGATFEKRHDTKDGHFITVPVIQLDKLLMDRVKPVNFIKMDVEGHELQVFKGANDILTVDRPKLIFECENRHLNSIKVEDVFEYLKSLDYQGFFFLNGKLTSIDQFDASKHQAIDDNKEIINKQLYSNNFVFEPKN
ncbi:FkbM family methyltransferase [Roseivirga sp. E12]|uniref:FkbM family methyltransferase n=1 Tax=Roseivirga sp. E12 TaxID=2819237 RepID=UPI001ABC4F95|nr:FkbM family methyltransferase [Roseivirga sp. E12]MBO3698540.1 FkbM family methyltransferase [Roseivirga sp. E12]